MKKQTIQEPKNSVPFDSIPRLAYTPAEAGAAIGRDKSWVYRQIYTGNLRVSASFGKRAMIPAAELERFVNTLGNYEVRNIGRRAHRKELSHIDHGEMNPIEKHIRYYPGRPQARFPCHQVQFPGF
jgi:hypothetical protein